MMVHIIFVAQTKIPTKMTKIIHDYQIIFVADVLNTRDVQTSQWRSSKGAEVHETDVVKERRV